MERRAWSVSGTPQVRTQATPSHHPLGMFGRGFEDVSLPRAIEQVVRQRLAPRNRDLYFGPHLLAKRACHDQLKRSIPAKVRSGHLQWRAEASQTRRRVCVCLPLVRVISIVSASLPLVRARMRRRTPGVRITDTHHLPTYPRRTCRSQGRSTPFRAGSYARPRRYWLPPHFRKMRLVFDPICGDNRPKGRRVGSRTSQRA